MPSRGRRLRALWLPVEVAFGADRRRAVLVPVLSLVAGAGGTVQALCLKMLLDAAVRGAVAGTVTAAAVLAVTVALTNLLGTAGARMRMAFQQQIGFVLDQRVLRLCASVPTIEHFERPAYLDRLEVLQATRGQLGVAYSTLIQNLRGATQITGILLVLSTVDARLLLLPFVAAPAGLAMSAGQRLMQRFEDRIAPRVRARRSVFTAATSVAGSKELRVSGVGGELSARHDRLLAGIARERRRAEVHAAGWSVAGRLLFTVAFLAAVGLVAHRAATGRASLGDVALVIVLAGQLDGVLSTVLGMVASLQRCLHAAGQYFWLVDYAASATAPAASDRAADRAADTVADIVLDHVSFSYPDTGRPVLRDVCLRLPAGAVVAVVGENGAGKSTLVKLLCGLYRPTAGSVRHGGTDLATVEPALWRARVSAGFQDHCRFEFLARESIGVGDLSAGHRDGPVGAALDLVGAGGLAGDLPAGLDTQLGRSFDGGVDLSTGQWQRVALARAAMRPAPALLLLDEPTASLDPDAEHALFQRFAATARHGAGRTTAVVVSHRFSTVRDADLIVVLDAGAVREAGTHEELMASGGTYAQLYGIQSRAYRASVEPPLPAGAVDVSA